MSYNKEARRIRRNKRQSAIAKQVVIHKQKNWVDSPITQRALGRMAKTATMDCGRPRCGLCSNARKLFGHLTMAERRSLITFGEME